MSFIRLRAASRLAARPAHPIAPTRLARAPKSTSTSTSGSGSMTQGHATFDKSADKGHTDKDVQSSYASAGQRQQHDSATPGEQGGDSPAHAAQGSGAEPFDAARQGGAGGETKKAPAEADMKDKGQKGAMKEQIGGHGLDQPGSSGSVEGTERAAGSGNAFQTAGDVVKKGFEGLKNMRDQKKNFSTSSRLAWPASPADGAPSDGTGSREPHVDPTSLPEGSTQSPHLKHGRAGSADSGKGNAAADPHLPSHTTGTQPKADATQGRPGGVGAKRQMSTSAPWHKKKEGEAGTTGALDSEGRKAGYNVPPEALPPTLKSTYDPAETRAGSTDHLHTTLETGHSSSASDPPHPVLREKALEGKLADRNPPPEPEAGKQGLKEAWKDRKQ